VVCLLRESFCMYRIDSVTCEPVREVKNQCTLGFSIIGHHLII
jgi:hypothetical protein